MPTSGRFVRATWLIAGCTFCSRVLGLVRECAFGYFFSTSELLSAFRIAFMAPNLARRLFGEGALSAALIPVMTRSIEAQGDEASRRFFGSLLTLLGAILVVFVVSAEAVIAVWRTLRDDTALVLAAILMPYMALICLVAAVGAVLNVRGHFAAPAAAPAILNLAMIAGIVGGSAWLGLTGRDLMYVVCVSVLIGGVIQLLATGWTLRVVRFTPLGGLGWRDPRIREVIGLMAPMVLGLSAVQINSLVDYVIAYSFIVENHERVGPAVLGYAQTIYQLPLGMFGIALATAIFPILAAKANEGDRAGLADVVARGIRMSLFVALPASVGLIFVAHPLVATLFERGRFDAQDTQRVSWVLAFYAAGLAAYFLQHVLVRTFYAMRDSKTPARIAGFMVVLNFALNLALVFPLKERGLALSTAVCATIQVIWLATRLNRQLPELRWRVIAGAVVRMLLATAVMSAVLAALSLPTVLGDAIGANAAIRLAVLVAAGVLSYALAAFLLRIEELRSVLRR